MGYKDIAAESPWVPDDGKPYEHHARRSYARHFGHEPPGHLVNHWRECQQERTQGEQEMEPDCGTVVQTPHGKRVAFQCRLCTKCCADLGILDRLRISIATRTIVWHYKCSFLDGNRCSIYDKRPSLCREWECGVLYECQ